MTSNQRRASLELENGAGSSRAVVGNKVLLGLADVDYRQVYEELKRDYLRNTEARAYWVEYSEPT